MIVKYFDLEKKIKDQTNFYLFYGHNTGLIEETINGVLKPIFSKNIFYYDENEILTKSDDFKEQIFNKSFFENKKLIIINRATDKILKVIEQIIDNQADDYKIIIKAGLLEKKSKLRYFFENNKKTIVVPFYEDNHQTLTKIAQNFFYEKKIRISQHDINYIVERVKGNRINLKNELKKIYFFCQKRKSIQLKDILKLTNLAENYDISELIDQCLAKNKKKTLNILNENNSSTEDNILILKNFLYKLKRLKKLKISMELNNNTEEVLSSFRPAIFWKDKDLVKQQLINWSLPQIKSLIKKVNNIELLIKKNTQIGNQVVNDFIIDKLKQINN